ncbi:TetR/AcrR family transcriptional regulator [Acinetobacter gyllenbergii]|uniref:TetR/AcrR family transcriptional regulator n=1 Tax=Acinetobacter gyllenbergii TaxID=134534 RepID=UPI00241E8260|nr:TetR/AcrR family transcriptional regulator [Acinetobacter gyllenbergii]
MKTVFKPRKIPRQGRSKVTVDAILQSAAEILKEMDYAKFNTNLVAERAGISIGSLYQYFPNKDALIVALHKKHTQHIHDLLRTVIDHQNAQTLKQRIESLVDAVIAAHSFEPELHQLLEKKLPFFDINRVEDETGIRDEIYRLVELHQDEIVEKNKSLMVWMILQLLESLIHAAVLEPPVNIAPLALRNAIIQSIYNYLTKT